MWGWSEFIHKSVLLKEKYSNDKNSDTSADLSHPCNWIKLKNFFWTDDLSDTHKKWQLNCKKDWDFSRVIIKVNQVSKSQQDISETAVCSQIKGRLIGSFGVFKKVFREFSVYVLKKEVTSNRKGENHVEQNDQRDTEYFMDESVCEKPLKLKSHQVRSELKISFHQNDC